jgi:hypothetical protein
MPQKRAFTAPAAAHDNKDIAAVDRKVKIALNHETAEGHGQVFDGDMRFITFRNLRHQIILLIQLQKISNIKHQIPNKSQYQKFQIPKREIPHCNCKHLRMDLTPL